jgi:hypothetical protein
MRARSFGAEVVAFSAAVGKLEILYDKENRTMKLTEECLISRAFCEKWGPDTASNLRSASGPDFHLEYLPTVDFYSSGFAVGVGAEAAPAPLVRFQN